MRKLLYCNQRNFSIALPAFDYTPAKYTGIPYEKVLEDRKNYMPPFNPHYYKEALLISEGRMQYLYDHKGNRYQDWISGISTVSVGHSHPRVISAIQEQFSKLMHVSQILLSNVQAQYAKQLCQELGPEYDAVYLCNSGGQANDFAIQLTKMFTNSNSFFSLRSGYHGMVGSAGNTTSVPNWVNSVSRVTGHEKLAWPSAYRSIHNSLDFLKKDALENINSNTNKKVAGFIFEPIQGVGGIEVYVDGYHKMITDVIHAHGGLVISDQVQTGFGRIGKKFWGFKHYDFKPDIVTMAKGIANGLPLAAVVTRKQIAQSLNCNFLNTTGGGNVQCRAAIQTLKIIKQQKLQENAENVGNYLLTQLAKIQEKSAVVGDTRGVGLMIGIDIVADKKTKEPSVALAVEIMEKLKDHRILVGRGGAGGNILRLQPPFCMSMQDAKYFIGHFQEILKDYK